MAVSPQQPIDLYYWPTPNGWKITIMLEECGLPYTVLPVNIGKGDQFKPEFLAISPNNQHAGHRRPRRAGRQADLGVRVGRDPAISRPQDGQVLPAGRARPRRGRCNGCSGRWAASARCSARRTISASTRRRRYRTPSTATPTRSNRLYGVMNKRLADRRIRGRRVFHRRHGHRPLGEALGAPGPEHRRVSPCQALARDRARPPGGPARHCGELRGPWKDRPHGSGGPGHPVRAEGAVDPHAFPSPLRGGAGVGVVRLREKVTERGAGSPLPEEEVTLL